jgi:hypothetical protein
MMVRRFVMVLRGANARGLMARLVLIAALAATVAACGDSTGTKAAAPTTTPPPVGTAAPHGQRWERVVPGGDCQCSDGSQFSFWVRKANPQEGRLLSRGRRRLLLGEDVRARKRPLQNQNPLRRRADRAGGRF